MKTLGYIALGVLGAAALLAIIRPDVLRQLTGTAMPAYPTGKPAQPATSGGWFGLGGKALDIVGDIVADELAGEVPDSAREFAGDLYDA